MIKNRIISAVVGTVLFFGFWTLLDYLYATFISRSGFTFDIWFNVAIPLIIGIVIFAVFIPMYNRDMDKSRVKYEGLHEKRHHKAPKEEK